MSRSIAMPVSLLAVSLFLSACSETGNRGLVSKFTGVGTTGPDEFLVLPQKPLEMPKDLAQLPPPTPGSANRVDLTPLADAQIALTGRTVAASGLTRSDQALLAATGAQNANANIRTVLAREDAALREDSPGLFFEKIFTPDLETLTYSDMTLNALAELARLRALGIITPAAPPAGDPQN
jgi:Protein of unknown function (DUF3035)